MGVVSPTLRESVDIVLAESKRKDLTQAPRLRYHYIWAHPGHEDSAISQLAYIVQTDNLYYGNGIENVELTIQMDIPIYQAAYLSFMNICVDILQGIVTLR